MATRPPFPDPDYPPCVVVHDAGHLRRLVEAACGAGATHIRPLSAPAAACFLGPAWWRALMALAPTFARGADLVLADILDCGDAPGRALEALRLGQRTLVLAPSPQWPAVRDRTALLGAELLSARPPALDLAEPGADRRLRHCLRADDSSPPPG